jgi:tetratricopeptide (TPR) repeat protein
MAVYSIFCPQCHTAVRSSSPLPPGRVIRCPQCSDHFTVIEPDTIPSLVAPVSSPVLKTGLVAFGLLGVIVLVIAAGLGLALLPKAEQARDQIAETNRRQIEAEKRANDENQALRERLEKQRAEIENQRREADRIKHWSEQKIQDLENQARARDERLAAVKSVLLPAAPPADAKPAAEDATRQTRADYEARVDAARAAMVDQRYADALREYKAALRLMPGDAVAARGERDAQDRLETQKDKTRRRDTLAGLLDKARSAVTAKHYDEALAAANEALRIAPDNGDARQIQRDATQARRASKADFNQLMSLADNALASGRFEEASRGYSQALQLFPDDAAAQRGKRQADQSSQDTQAGLTAYYRFMTLGALSMQNLQPVDAARSFAEALRLIPGDLGAARGLRDAQLAVNGAIVGQAQYYQQVQAGYSALSARRIPDAIAAFQAALRLVPDSPVAVAGLRQARALAR